VRVLASAGAIVAGAFNIAGDALGLTAASIRALFTDGREASDRMRKEARGSLVGGMRWIREDVEAIWEETEVATITLTDAIEDDTALPFNAAKSGGKKIVDEAERIWKQVEQAVQRIGRDVATFFMTDDQVVLFDLRIQGADP